MLGSLLVALLALAPVSSDDAGDRHANYVVGDVLALDPAARRLTLKPDVGDVLVVTLLPGAAIVRAAPGASALEGAAPLPFDWITMGDRVLARGLSRSEAGELEARQLVVMGRIDLERKHAAERADWHARGLLGVVTAIDAATGEIAIRTGRRPDAPSAVVASAGRAVAFLRYAPNSVKFSDARPSTLAELKVGDELRALGERAPDGVLRAERIVFGSFRSVAGTVTAVDPATSSVSVRDDAARKPLTVSVSADTRLRRLPADAGGFRRGPDAAPEDVLDQLPAIALADIKVGERVLVSSVAGSDPGRVNAIALVAGLSAPGFTPGAGRGRGGDESGPPPELMDFGMSLP